MRRGYVGVFQNLCVSQWSPAGSQAIDRVVWPISALDFSWLQIPYFGSVRVGSQPLIRLRAHPGAFCLCSQAAGRLSGRPPTRDFRCGPQATDWGTHPLGHFGSGTQAAGPLFRALAHPGFQVWAPRRAPAGLQVSAGAGFPSSQSRDCGGRGASGRGCCGELSSSMFSFSFREIRPIQAPLVQTSTWPLT